MVGLGAGLKGEFGGNGWVESGVGVLRAFGDEASGPEIPAKFIVRLGAEIQNKFGGQIWVE